MMRSLLLAAACLLAASGIAQAQQPAAPSGSADNGKKLYMADGCYQCHNMAAQGGPGTGPKLAPAPIPFANFLQQLRHPRYEMPPYEAVLVSDQQAADIYAFLLSVPKQPDYKTIPLLN
jgi:cytochrome c553